MLRLLGFDLRHLLTFAKSPPLDRGQIAPGRGMLALASGKILLRCVRKGGAVISEQTLTNEWHVVFRSADLGAGETRRVRLLGRDLVLWRAQGRAMAWLDLCIHRGARFSMGCVKNAEIECPYHGWRYGEDGRCTLIPSQPDLPIPAKARAVTYRCEERYGFIWVCLGEPWRDIPAHPQWDDAKFIKVFTGPYEFQSSGPRVIENVVDVTHFPFVHDAMLGQESDPDEVPQYEVHHGNDGLRTGPVTVFQPVGDHRRIPVQSTYRFWIPSPLVCYLMKELDDERCFSHFMLVTPEEHNRCRLWVLTSANYDKDGAEARITERNGEVFGQDQPIVDSQRPELIPQDIAAELHVRADQLSVRYRRWLLQGAP